MCKTMLRLLSVILVIVMVANMLPMQSFAADYRASLTADTQITEEDMTAADAQVVEEITEKRTEYSKEFLLSNGLHMAVVYPDPVHYEVEGGWEEIDNTLKANLDGTYTNTAGVWDVRFPQQLTGEKYVTVTKDGYTLSFAMAGEVRSNDELATASLTAAEAVSVNAMQTSTAKLQTVDMTALKESLQYAEMAPEKLQSRLVYENVYANTNIIYDLDSNKVKESVVLESYSSTLRGYRYTLNVGQLLPVLEEDGHIDFLDAAGKTIVMTMPAPYLVDAASAFSDDIQVRLTGSGSTYTLTYLLPQQWLASADRAWPVVLDPVIEAETDVLNIEDRRIAENASWAHNHHLLETGYDDTYGKTRSYLKFVELPVLTSSDVVVGASIHLCQPTTRSDPSMELCVEVRKINQTWDSETITWANQPALDPVVEDYCMVGGTPDYYSWVITDIVRDWYANGNNGLVFKSTDANESAGVDSWMQFCSSDYNAGTTDEAAPKPVLLIQFRNNNGLESYWDYTGSSAGRAGTGYVNSYTGNLVWVRDDIGFGGNRMPVSISHVYNANDILNFDADSENNNNSNDTAGNFFGMGIGWRTNFHQRLHYWNKSEEDLEYYFWEDADGTDHYFKADDEGVLRDEDGLELTLTTDGSVTQKYCITDKYGNKSYFDIHGRLTKQENNQETKSSITVAYTTANGPLISTVTDGAGRVYRFTYNSSGLLTRIGYYSTGSAEISYVAFGYSGSLLKTVTDKDGEQCVYTYSGSLLASARDIDGYKVAYTYNTVSEAWQPYRVIKVSEYDGTVQGGELTMEYAHNQTTFTDHNGNVEIMQFNDFGNTVSIQDDEGHAQYAQYALNTADEAEANQDATKKGNQLRLSSKLQNTVGNRMKNSSFENGEVWSVWPSGTSCQNVTTEAYMGNRSLLFTATQWSCLMSEYFTIEPGATYTFSAYLKGVSGYSKMMIVDRGSMNSTGITSTDGATGWVRAEVSYTNTTSSNITACAQLFGDVGTQVYFDCVQVEKASTASRYNLIENGDFRHGTQGWSLDSLTGTDGTVTSADPTPATELENTVAQLTGNPETVKHIYQRVLVSGAAGDTFILSGWAKGDSVPLLENTDRDIGLYLCFNYADGSYHTENFHFNPDTDSENSWQYGSWAAVAKKAYTSINIDIRYDYNMNTACFDGIQLFKEEFGSSYTYDEEGNVKSVVDLQKQTTTYEYDSSSNLTQVIQNGKAKMTYTYYENSHNVKTATTATGAVYEFKYDTYGNNTQVSITSGGQTMTSKAVYTSGGNYLDYTEDALGNRTTYGYDQNTGVLNWVQYPEDTEATRTNHTYDSMYRLASAAAATDTGTALTASYTYTDDLLTSITTGSTTYSFAYGDFALRSSVKIGNRTLASYSYTDDRNHYLEKLDYGNGDSVEYTYDDKGRVTSQTYEDGDTVTYTYDNSGALAKLYDSATGRTTTYYYDLTDRLMKYEESGTGYSHSIGYEYDTLNNLTQLVETINGVEHTTTYAYDEDNRITASTTDGVTVEYAYGAFGRVTTQTTKNGNTVILTENYTYKAPTSTTTSAQIATYTTTAPDGYSVTYSYTYDDNGNITSIFDGTKTTSYVYDSANQLIRENNPVAGKTWTWTYDDAGNILSRKEYAYTTSTLGTPTDTVTYTYGDSDWGDLLTAYDGNTITYDTIGNPLTDGTRTYTWEHGRQLASLSKGVNTWIYTYDADGMRTSRSNGTTIYTYVYNGSQLVRMTYDDYYGRYTMDFHYDANGTPLSVDFEEYWYEHYNVYDEELGEYIDTYNTYPCCNETYYYITNLQGDVVAIVDSSGALQAEYAYDAWGRISMIYYNDCIAYVNPLHYRGYVYDDETGLYYLQSRYYDPVKGRFLNADGLVSTEQSFIGNNMYAYCLNNPANYVDSMGRMAMRSNIVLINDGARAQEKKTLPECINATVVVGVGGGVTVGPWTFAGQLGIAADLNDNVELQFTYSVPFSTASPSTNDMINNDAGLGVSAAVSVTLTNAPDVTSLHGIGHQTGVSFGRAAIDINTIPSEKTTYSGITFSGGLVSPDFHHTMGYTVRVAKLNINFWDIVDAAYKGWLGVN